MEGDEPEPQLSNAADPAITAEQIADATALQLNWRKRNKKLFGALGTGVPEYIRTSLYTSDRNDGVSSLTYLRTHYDSRDGDGNDRASALQRLQASYIDSRNDLSENDVRHQHDNMMISVRDIVSAGGARPDELLLISMFENSVPIAYSTIKQMTRRMNHTTLLGYYQDLLSQTRAELASRAPAIHAFAAGGASRDDGDDSVQALAAMGLQRIAPPPSPGHLGGGRGSAKGRGADRAGRGRGAPYTGAPPGGYPANPCLRCGEAHSRANCTKPPVSCRFCSADHAAPYCLKNPTAGAKRKALSQGARAMLDREAGSAPPSPNPAATALEVATATPSLSEAAAHAAASAAAAAQTDNVSSADAYSATLRMIVGVQHVRHRYECIGANHSQLPGCSKPTTFLHTCSSDSGLDGNLLCRQQTRASCLCHQQQSWFYRTHGSWCAAYPCCWRRTRLAARLGRCVEVLRSTQCLAHAGLQLDTVLCARHARPLWLQAASTTLTIAR